MSVTRGTRSKSGVRFSIPLFSPTTTFKETVQPKSEMLSFAHAFEFLDYPFKKKKVSPFRTRTELQSEKVTHTNTTEHKAHLIIMQMQCPWQHKVHRFKQIFVLSSVHRHRGEEIGQRCHVRTPNLPRRRQDTTCTRHPGTYGSCPSRDTSQRHAGWPFLTVTLSRVICDPAGHHLAWTPLAACRRPRRQSSPHLHWNSSDYQRNTHLAQRGTLN